MKSTAFAFFGSIALVLMGLNNLRHGMHIGGWSDVVDAMLLPVGIFNTAVFGYMLLRQR